MNWLMLQPIGELVFRFEIWDNRLEHGGVQESVTGKKWNVLIYDGRPLGGWFPFHAIVFGDFFKEFNHRDFLARDVDSSRREILLQDRRDGFRKIIDMRQCPRLVQIAVEHQGLALACQCKAFVDMAGMRREGIRLAVQLTVTEDMRCYSISAETAPCLQQHLRLHDGGIPQTMRIDFGIFTDAAAIGVADVRGGEIDEMDLSIHRMDGGQMFAKRCKRLDMQVAVLRHIMAEEDQIAIGRKIVMTIIHLMIGHRNGLRHRILRPVCGHSVADCGHGFGQMGSDEGVCTDDHDFFRTPLIPEDHFLLGVKIYDGQPLTIHNYKGATLKSRAQIFPFTYLEQMFLPPLRGSMCILLPPRGLRSRLWRSLHPRLCSCRPHGA